ncbi:MAG TPA: dUTP diphosphatase [Candidatus Ornithospirochaeta stercorigallinarum]|nr:dUTP diphosphatase [Candidatus Ornithospirochaeta stercorigallinarum]
MALVRYRVEDGVLAPSYQSSGSSGMDVRAHLSESLVIKPGRSALVPTGLYLEIPSGYEVQVRSRSGLALKNGIMVLNSPGTIDSDYRGEIKVILMNLSSEDFVINNNDRIAQLVLSRYEKAELVLSDQLEETERGSGGFGSTGV